MQNRNLHRNKGAQTKTEMKQTAACETLSELQYFPSGTLELSGLSDNAFHSVASFSE